MIHAPASKMNDFWVKDLSNSGAIICNLCLELAILHWRFIESALISASLASFPVEKHPIRTISGNYALKTILFLTRSPACSLRLP